MTKAGDMYSFINGLKDDYTDTQIVAMILEGLNAVQEGQTNGRMSDNECQMYLFLK